MKIFVHLFLIAACVLCFHSTATAQETEVVDRKEIEFLLELDYDTASIIAYLKEGNRTLKIDPVDLRFMEKKKAPKELIAFLRKNMAPAAEVFDLNTVLDHWKRHADEARLVKLIKAKNPGFVLTVPQTIELMRAEVPKSIIKALREDKTNKIIPLAARKSLALDAIVIMANNGKSDEEIIKTIKKSTAIYDVDAARILELKTDGLSVAVLQEIFSRRKNVEEKEAPVEQPTSKPTKEMTSDTPTLELFRDGGIGISLLKPVDFVVTKEFQSVKALIQMVAPLEDSTRDLPDLELSIMVVHPRKKSTKTLNSADLAPVAASFAQGLRDQFAKDGINMATEKPVASWIANRRTLKIATQAQVKKTRTGYQGASYLLYDQGRIVVISYSMRLEKAHQWRPILESCVHSLVFDHGEITPPPAESATRREQVIQLFKTWRRAIRHLDFKSYLAVHHGMLDTVQSRQAFLSLAQGINEEGKRVEINGVDFPKNTINYNVFSVDGMSPFQLGFAKDKSRWVLTGLKAR